MSSTLRQCLSACEIAEQVDAVDLEGDNDVDLEEDNDVDLPLELDDDNHNKDDSPSTHLLSSKTRVRVIDYESTGHLGGPDGFDSPKASSVRVCGHGRGVPLSISEPHRFWQLVVGAFCCFVVSTSFTFNLYSGQLQSKFNLTQNDLTSIFTASDVSGVFMLPLGAVYDWYGTRPIFVFALLTQPVGAALLALTFADVIQGKLWLLILYSALQTTGTWLLDTAAVVTLLSIFPADHGPVVALTKVITGIGYGIIGVIHLAFFSGGEDRDTRNFFIFVACVGVVAVILGFIYLELPSYVVRGYEEGTLTRQELRNRRRLKRVYLSQRPPGIRFIIGFGLMAVLIVYLPVVAIFSMYFPVSHWHHIFFACTTIGLLALYPVMALPLSCLDNSPSLPLPVLSARSSSRCSRASRATSASGEGAALVEEMEYIAPQFHSRIGENVKTLRFWLLMWIVFSLSGAEVLVLANMRFLLGALDGKLLDDTYVELLIVVTGVGSGLGRVSLSLFEVLTQKRPAEDRIPVTITLFVPTILQVVALGLFPLLPASTFAFLCFVVSFAGGCNAAASIIVIRSVFANDVGKHYNCITLATVASSVLINRVVYGEVYSHEAAKEGSTTCVGKQCVMLPIMVCFVNCVLSLFAVTYFHWDYSAYCHRMLQMRKRRKGPHGLVNKLSLLHSDAQDAGVQ